MNRERRKEIKGVIKKLQELNSDVAKLSFNGDEQSKNKLKEIIENLTQINLNISEIEYSESDARDNLPQSLQDSEMVFVMDECVEILMKSQKNINSVIADLNKIFDL